MSYKKIQCEVIVCDGPDCAEEYENGDYTPHFSDGSDAGFHYDNGDPDSWQKVGASHFCRSHRVPTDYCENCEELIVRYGGAWLHDEDGLVTCPEAAPPPDRPSATAALPVEDVE